MKYLILYIIFICFYQVKSQSFIDAGIPIKVFTLKNITIDTLNNKMYTVGLQALDGSGNAALNTVYNYDGYSWSTMDTLNDWANTSIIYNGELIVGAGFTDSLGVSQNYLSKWDGVKWVHFGDSINNRVTKMRIINNELYFTGPFTHIGNIDAKGVAKWDGTNWYNVYNCPFSWVTDCIMYNGDFYICGNFDSTALGIVDLAVYKAGTWQKVGGADCPKGFLGSVGCMEVYKSELYIGGFISKVEGNVGHGIQKWNGISWSEVGTGLQDNNNATVGWVTTLAFMTYQNKLYVAGSYGYAGNIYANGLSTWDGNQWCSIDTTFIGANAIAVFNDTLFVNVGAADTISGIYINQLAKFLDITADSCSIGFGVDEIGDEIGISIYPNPNNGSFQINLNKPTLGVLEILNSIGQIVFTKVLTNETNIDISLPNLSQGIYFVSVQAEDFFTTKKLIKE
jgi:hypothetical protein